MPLERLRQGFSQIFAAPQALIGNVVKKFNQPITARGIGTNRPNFTQPIQIIRNFTTSFNKPITAQGVGGQGYGLLNQPARTRIQPSTVNRYMNVQNFVPQPIKQARLNIGQTLQRFPTIDQLKFNVPFLNNVLPRDPISRFVANQPSETVRSIGRVLANPKPLEQRTFGEKLEAFGNLAMVAPIGRIAGKLPGLRGAINKQLEPAVKYLRGRLTPQDVAEIEEFIDLSFKSRGRGNLGKIGQLTHAGLTEAIPEAKTWGSQRLAKAAQYILNRLSESPDTSAKLGLSIADIGQQFQKERGFIKTVRGAKLTAPEVAAGVKGTYSPITNQGTLTQAQQIVDQGYDVAKQRVLKEPLSAETNVIGQEIMRRAQSEGRFDEAIELAETLAKKGTEAGQATQAFSIWSRLTPEGMLRYAAKTIQQATSERGVLDKVFGKIPKQLTPKDSELITDFMNKANQATDPASQEKYAKLALDVINDKIPYGVNEMLDTFRLNNILSNPRSHMRNIWGNLLNTYALRPAQLAAEGRPLEAIKYEVGALKSLPDAIEDGLKAFKGDLSTFGKLDIRQTRGKKAPIIFSGALRALEAEDKFFTRLIQSGEIARGKTAEQATKFADELLFRKSIGDKEAQGYLLNFLDDSIGSLLKFAARTPAVNWFVPFARTPFNIAKMSLEYSPVGLVTIPGAQNTRNQVAKAAIGSLVTLFGAQLAMEGRTTFAPPTDPEAKELFYGSGKRPFSIQVGDKWIPVAYLGPLGFSMMLPAMVKYYNDEAPTALTSGDTEKMFQLANAMIYYWSQQTPLAGVGNFVDLARGNTDLNFLRNLGFTASQIILYTGLFNYATQVLDPIFRRPQGFGEQVLAGIPELSKNLDYYTTPEGLPAERPPSATSLPYTLGTREPQYEIPLKARNTRLQENKFLKESDKDFERIEERAKDLIESGNLDQARTIIAENKDLFQKGMLIKEARKRIRTLQDVRDEAASDKRLTEEQRQRMMETIQQEMQRHLNLVEGL